jgi:hypothetical protein
MNTKSISKRLLIATPTMIVCFLLASGTSAVAQSPKSESGGGGQCSNKTLKGDYGSQIEGTILGPNAPIRGVAMAHFDGNGNMTQVDHIVFNGFPPPQEWNPGYGTYTVNPDCTGSIVITNDPNSPPLTVHIVIVNSGKQFNQVVDANAVTAIAYRVN